MTAVNAAGISARNLAVASWMQLGVFGCAPFAGIEPPYITCWKGFRTMLRSVGGYVGGAPFPQAKALEPVA
jgi:hypothetical protein